MLFKRRETFKILLKNTSKGFIKSKIMNQNCTYLKYELNTMLDTPAASPLNFIKCHMKTADIVVFDVYLIFLNIPS